VQKTKIRLGFPLYFSVLFIVIVVGTSPLFNKFGFWKYIIIGVSVSFISWLLGKFNIPAKRVALGVGILIILLGFIVGIVFDKLTS